MQVAACARSGLEARLGCQARAAAQSHGRTREHRRSCHRCRGWLQALARVPQMLRAPPACGCESTALVITLRRLGTRPARQASLRWCPSPPTSPSPKASSYINATAPPSTSPHWTCAPRSSSSSPMATRSPVQVRKMRRYRASHELGRPHHVATRCHPRLSPRRLADMLVNNDRVCLWVGPQQFVGDIHDTDSVRSFLEECEADSGPLLWTSQVRVCVRVQCT